MDPSRKAGYGHAIARSISGVMLVVASLMMFPSLLEAVVVVYGTSQMSSKDLFQHEHC